MTKQFEAGKTYSTRSLCDWDCIYSFRIVARTEKTVKVTIRGKEEIRKITVRDGVESIKPHGSYSMACVLYATDTADSRGGARG